MQRLTKQPMQALEKLEKKMLEIYVGITVGSVSQHIVQGWRQQCDASHTHNTHTHTTHTHTVTSGPPARSHGHFDKHVRNTDDFKEYNKCGIAAVDTSYSLY